MPKNKTFYITTTLPYVNAEAHLGHALEFVRADIIARHKRLMGFDVFFNTGTDEHGVKIYRKALEQKKDPQEYADEYAAKFKALKEKLDLSFNSFVRTTDEHHIKAAQEFWKRCEAAGDIYKKIYKINYCVGCELEKTESELVDGRCPDHPSLTLENIEEENYFFRFSKYQQPLLDLYANNPQFVLPDFRLNEIKRFVERGLEDFSVSRLKSKMPWGIPVPGDECHIMYVWFDALVNYVSAIGWPDRMEEFGNWWPVTQYAGKDNLRQQSAIWQAMLMSAKIEPSKQIIINGFITAAGGVKMSKSLGNVVNPLDLVAEYGTDALRYYLAREISVFEDSPFDPETFKAAYNASLANGIGNLTNRIMKLAETNLEKPVEVVSQELPEEFTSALDTFEIKQAADFVWQKITALDQKIQETKPFSVVKTDKEAGQKIIIELVAELYAISQMLVPIIPDTAEKIQSAIKANKMPAQPLFLRKD